MSWTVSDIETYWLDYLRNDYKELSTVKKLRCLVNGIMLGKERVSVLIPDLWRELEPQIVQTSGSRESAQKLLDKVILECKGDGRVVSILSIPN